ncbi:hypothetical protein [Amycolatopsis anabasis]|uniref:hypothetical protein n=1 Tax=Amycolatopsis anabasis TaxID=1840409 RepID=UPI001FECE22D|nr:hypothetical protein [Amycolatopsis anabasis]
MAEGPMTGPGFEADADRLAGRAKDFDGLAERAASIAADLDRALDGAEATWGADAVGRSFAAAHGGPADEAVRRLGGLADRIGGVGGKFAEAAASYRDTDTGAAGTLPGAEG